MGRASEEARKRAFEDNGGSRRGGHLGVREGEQRVPPQEQAGGQQGAVQLRAHQPVQPEHLQVLRPGEREVGGDRVGRGRGGGDQVPPQQLVQALGRREQVTTKRNARKAMASIEKQLDGWRSDLVVAAKARMSVVQKGLRIKKKASA